MRSSLLFVTAAALLTAAPAGAATTSTPQPAVKPAAARTVVHTRVPVHYPVRHHVRHAVTCKDKLMCSKIDALSAKLSGQVADLDASVKAGQTADASYQTQQLALSGQMLESMKAIQAQGGQSYQAIVLSFSDRKLGDGEKAADVANQMCVDDGFKTGKPVDVSAKHGWGSDHGTYLKSVVCTY